jgi:(1->4)-alpha-D-glucan 1-alpha-D-glucosylmutase
MPPQAGASDAATLRRRWRDEPLPGGLHKLFITWRLLQWRRRAEALCRDGGYRPLEIEGPDARHLIAFAREGANGEAAVTIVPRLAWTLGAGRIERVLTHEWRDTMLCWPAELAGDWRDVLVSPGAVAAAAQGENAHRLSLTAERVPVAALLSGGPVAVLHRAPP